MNYSELMPLDPESLTLDADFELFLKHRSAVLDKAFVEEDRAFLEDIRKADQFNLEQLNESRERIASMLHNLSKVRQYEQMPTL